MTACSFYYHPCLSQTMSVTTTMDSSLKALGVLAKMKYFPEPPVEPTFHLFPLLPLEIRRKIWACRFPGPRHLRMKSEALRSMRTVYLEVTTFNDPFRAWTPEMIYAEQVESDLHITMQVNRESRMETLRLFRVLYTKDALGSLTPYPISKTTARQARSDSRRAWKPVFFNPMVDTISVRRCALEGKFEAQKNVSWLRHIERNLSCGKHIRQLEIIYDSSDSNSSSIRSHRGMGLLYKLVIGDGIEKLLSVCKGLQVLSLNLDMTAFDGDCDGLERNFRTMFTSWYQYRTDLLLRLPDIQIQSVRPSVESRS